MGFLILLATMAVVAVLVTQRLRRTGAGTVEVAADADGVRRVLADGRREEVTWAEVTEVDVFTTRIGPHRAAGGAVVLYGDDRRGCVVPLDRLQESALLEHVHRLPGFDTGALVAAIGDEPEATSPRGFPAPRPRSHTTVCWQRRPA